MLQTIQGYSQIVYIQNGSFENYNKLPNKITSNSLDAFTQNEFMKCLSFWAIETPYPWDPQFTTYYVYNKPRWEQSNNQPPLTKCDNCWYLPTILGTADYFHTEGNGAVRSPNVNPFADYTNLAEKRFPFGYSYQNTQDYKGFAGFRVDFKDPQYFDKRNKEFTTYKEYIQQKLANPLTPGRYEVSFYVSRSQNASFNLNQIGAYFSIDPVLNFNQNKGWSINLAEAVGNEFLFVDYPQITSPKDAILNSTANEFGLEGWMKVSGELKVYTGTSYNYITIGNFQNDKDLSKDHLVDQNNLNNFRGHRITYYYIDSISIKKIEELPGFCICKNKFNVNYTLFDTTSQGCCYHYRIQVPPFGSLGSAEICPISKIQIHMDDIVVEEIVASNGTFLNGNEYDGTICNNNKTKNNTIRTSLFSKDVNQNYFLLDCDDEQIFKCKCDCDELGDFPWPEGSLEFLLIKNSGYGYLGCCWDLFISNPISFDQTKSCYFDLSDYVIKLNSIGLNNFSISSGSFEAYDLYDVFKYWKAPSNFLVNPNSYSKIGTICTKNPILTEDINIDFYMYNHPIDIFTLPSENCKKVLSQTLNCFQTIDCKTLIAFYHKDTVSSNDFDIIISDINFPNNNPNIKCNYPIYLKFNFSPDSCFYYDTLKVELYTNEEPDWIIYSSEFVIKDLYYREYYLAKLKLFGADNKIVNARIINKANLDTLIISDTLVCPDNSFEKYYYPEIGTDTYITKLKIIPNPVVTEMNISFESSNTQEIEIQICNLLGYVILTEKIQCQKGLNNQTMLINDIPNGSYYLKLVKDNKVLTEKLIKID